MRKYILDAHGEPIEEGNVLAWADWFETSFESRTVAREEVGQCVISTVFLGLDHNFSGGGPILWETMIFGGPLNHQESQPV